MNHKLSELSLGCHALIWSFIAIESSSLWNKAAVVKVSDNEAFPRYLCWNKVAGVKVDAISSDITMIVRNESISQFLRNKTGNQETQALWWLGWWTWQRWEETSVTEHFFILLLVWLQRHIPVPRLYNYTNTIVQLFSVVPQVLEPSGSEFGCAGNSCTRNLQWSVVIHRSHDRSLLGCTEILWDISFSLLRPFFDRDFAIVSWMKVGLFWYAA